jgi:hypothetical protein
MSVLVTIRFTGDTAQFRRSLTDRKDEFATIAERARGKGGLHHRFGVGDGFVLVVDEWESAGAFQAFFGDPQLQTFIGSVGANTSVQPDITITDAVDSPDAF